MSSQCQYAFLSQVRQFLKFYLFSLKPCQQTVYILHRWGYGGKGFRLLCMLDHMKMKKGE